MKKAVVLLLILFVAVAGVSFAQDDDSPELITIEVPGLHPEGIEWDAEGERFLVSSVMSGTVSAVADDGTTTPFIESENLTGAIGIHIDHENNRLLVAGANLMAALDPEAPSVAQLGIYDLETGEELHFVDLGSLYEGRHFANDVTTDPDGNAYVTNLLSPVIFKVDIEGNAEVLIENEAFSAEGFGLNGIDYHPDGYLLVAVVDPMEVYKVPVDDPESFTMVELSEPLGIDGMILHENGDLIAVATTLDDEGNPQNETVMVGSDDDWATATVMARGVTLPDAFPTTVALRDGHAFVLHAHFGELLAGESADAFEIVRVDFEDDMGDDMDDDDMDDDMDDDESEEDSD